MFGNSNSFSNIFGGVQDSHQRLFGGDRNLATKDIQGAQPRKFTKHVWGNYEVNSYQNSLSYDPRLSSIKSTILGESVPILNRAIPNSSGLIFRDQHVSSPQSTKIQTTTPVIDTSKLMQQPRVSSGKKAQTLQSYPKDIRDSKFSVIPTDKVQQQGSFDRLERPHIKSINPVSQVRQQNIFSLPFYTNPEQNAQKPLIGDHNSNEGVHQMSMMKQKLDRYRQVHSNGFARSSLNILQTKRSPESFVGTKRNELRLEQDRSNALGNEDHSKNMLMQDKLYSSQQNPVFKQNRNYGPDSVLFNSFYTPQNKNTFNYSYNDQNNEGQVNQRATQTASATSANFNIQQHEEPTQTGKTPLTYLNNKSDALRNESSGNPNMESQPLEQERVRSVLSSRGKLLLSQQGLRNKTSNSEYGLNVVSAQDGNQGQLYQQQQAQKEKILYQSKRDNFLRSHLIRSQSAEGQRIVNDMMSKPSVGQGTSQLNEQYHSNNNQSSQLNAKARMAAIRHGLQDYNNVGNAYMNSNIELSKTDPYRLQQNNQIHADPYSHEPKIWSRNGETDSQAAAFQKSGNIRVPVAGVQNKYSEFSNKAQFYTKSVQEQYHPHQPQSEVKFFGGKALKNLSNIRLY